MKQQQWLTDRRLDMSKQTKHKNFISMHSSPERGTSVETLRSTILYHFTIYHGETTNQLSFAIEKQSKQNLCLLSFFWQVKPWIKYKGIWKQQSKPDDRRERREGGSRVNERTPRWSSFTTAANLGESCHMEKWVQWCQYCLIFFKKTPNSKSLYEYYPNKLKFFKLQAIKV